MEYEAVTYSKHVLLGKTKRFFRETFGKGPENISIKIADELIVMRITGYLRGVELEVADKFPENIGFILHYRRGLFGFKKQSFISEIEGVLDRKISSIAFEPDISRNTALLLLVLDRPL